MGHSLWLVANLIWKFIGVQQSFTVRSSCISSAIDSCLYRLMLLHKQTGFNVKQQIKLKKLKTNKKILLCLYLNPWWAHISKAVSGCSTQSHKWKTEEVFRGTESTHRRRDWKKLAWISLEKTWLSDRVARVVLVIG